MVIQSLISKSLKNAIVSDKHSSPCNKGPNCPLLLSPEPTGSHNFSVVLHC